MMNTTIGEISNIMLPFATAINVFMHGPFPCINASIGNINNTTKLFISVKQVDDNTYAAAVTDDVYNGKRLLPTDYIDPPFIEEKSWFGYQSEITCKNGMTSAQFTIWFYKVMYDNQIIRFNPSDWSKKFTELGFNSLKIRRVIDRAYRAAKCGRNDIRELIYVVNTKKLKFDLTELEDKELGCVYAKLRSIGLLSTIQDKCITHIQYERRV